jgi:hypothetical protein
MAHDFAVYNKPCLYLNYNPVKENNWNVDDIYKFEHFKSMDGLNAVGWVNNKKDFFEKILQALNKPELVGNDRLVWLKKIIKNPIEENSLELVAKILEEF